MNATISVIMAVYNGEKYLGEAIESILVQTFTDFEFIIVDDASTDNSPAIIEEYRKADPRIRVLRNDENVGLGVSLQRGLKLAKGEFIARMDADDISTPDRFEKQHAFFAAHPEINILGGDEWIIDEDGTVTGELITSKLPGVMRWNMLLGNGIITPHPCAMIRRSFLEQLGGFGDQRAAQDFELWSRTFTMNQLPIANLSDKILFYRQHSQTNTITLKDEQEEVAVSTRRQTIEKMLGEKILEEVVTAYRHTSCDHPDIGTLMQTWVKIYRAFIDHFNPDNNELDHIQREMAQRLSHYTFLNPLAKEKKGRIPFLNSIKWLPGELTKRVLDSKLRSGLMNRL